MKELFHVWLGKSRRKRQSRLSSRRILTSGRDQKLHTNLFKYGNPPLAARWGILREIADRMPGLQMIEQTFHRHARADEDRRPDQNRRVGMDDAFTFHERSLPQGLAASR